LIDLTGVTFTGNVISKTSGTSAVKISTGTTISNCSFTALGSSDYAIEIPVAGTYSLTGITYAGYGTNKHLNVSATTGTVTVNISGGDIPSYTSAGATVSIVASATVAVNGLATGSRVKAYKISDGTILYNGLESGGSISFSTDYTGAVGIEARKASSAPYYIPWQTQLTPVVGATTTATALQQLDQ
jgi:hypothetical protein